MTLLTILERLSVILVLCSFIFQYSTVVLKTLLAILSNDYHRLAGAEGGSRLSRTRGRLGRAGARVCKWSRVGGRAGARWLSRLVEQVHLGDHPR
jgi:hypothetical protein